MQKYIIWGGWLAAAYLIGSIPFGFLIGKLRGIDVRTVGSKNIGATNVFRTVGKKWGLLAFACDFLKGYAPTALAAAEYGITELPIAVGMMCVVGHTLTVFMKFRGGKGVATAFGMLMALMPAFVSAAFLVFTIAFALSHYISLGSCLAAAFLAIGIWFHPSAILTMKIVLTIIGAFVICKHKANIVRLARHEENKIFLFGKPS